MGEDQKDESHRVMLTQPFYIGVFETTQRQWELVMGDNPSEAKGEMRPVEKVSWNKIRGDSKVHDWPAKHRPDRAGGFDVRHTVVGSYQPNAWGLYDLHGNIWEWCRDWRGNPPTYGTDPVGAASASYRVLRGGGWNYGASYCASSYRGFDYPSSGHSDCGFRLSCPAGSSAK